jgi:DNA-binding transcriptional LysR family regulator
MCRSYNSLMKLLRLRYFTALAEDLHFGRAARRLLVSQPSLSRQIQILEQEVGATLFERGTRSVVLTSAGHEYLNQTREILQRIDAASEIARRAARGESGRLHIGFYYLAGLDVLPPILKAFRRQYPDVALELLELPSAVQQVELRKGNLDVGIVREPTTVRNLAAEPIYSEDLVAVLPASHRLARRAGVRLADLSGESFIMVPRSDGAALYDIVISACAAAGFSPHVIQGVRQFVTVVSLVAADMGVAILPQVCTRIRHKSVVYRRLIPRVSVHSGLIWNAQDAERNPALDAFIKTCRTALKPLSR